MNLRKYIFANIKANKTKYLSGMLAVSFAIGSVFCLSILAEQMEISVDRVFFADENSLFISERDAYYGHLIPANSRIPENLTDEIEKITGVTMTFKVIFHQRTEHFSTDLIQEFIIGISGVHIETFIGSDALNEGRLYRSADEVVVGPNFMGGELNVGDTIEINEVEFEIAGILSHDNALFDSIVFMDYFAAQNALNLEGYCSAIYVLINPNFDLAVISAEIGELSPDIEVIDYDRINILLGGLLGYLDAAKMILIVVPLFVSMLIFYSIFLHIIQSRLKEFGILKSMGMANQSIVGMIFLETIFITAIAYLLGFVFGWLLFAISYSIILDTTFTMSESMNLFFQFLSGEIIIGTFFLSQIINLTTAAIPSFSTLRKDLIQVFRE